MAATVRTFINALEFGDSQILAANRDETNILASEKPGTPSKRKRAAPGTASGTRKKPSVVAEISENHTVTVPKENPRVPKENPVDSDDLPYPIKFIKAFIEKQNGVFRYFIFDKIYIYIQ
jgi:hypothetical protein